MKSKTTKAMIIASVLAAAASVGAGENPDRSAELQAARERMAFEAHATKGTPSHLRLHEERRLQRLIRDLEQGRAVDPAEIDRALERADQIR